MTTDPRPLSDDEVYALLHAAQATFQNRTVATPTGQKILSAAIRDMDILMIAMVAMQEQQQERTGS